MSFYDPPTFTADKAISAAAVNRAFYNNIVWLYAQFPQRATLLHDDSTVINGGTITGTNDTAELLGTYFYQSPAAVDDQWSQSVRLGAGVYDVVFRGQQYYSGGMFSVDLDGLSIGDGFDSYSGVTQRAVDLLDGTGAVELVRSGVYTLTVTVYDKNGSSIGYGLRIAAIEFIPKAREI